MQQPLLKFELKWCIILKLSDATHLLDIGTVFGAQLFQRAIEVCHVNGWETGGNITETTVTNCSREHFLYVAVLESVFSQLVFSVRDLIGLGV